MCVHERQLICCLSLPPPAPTLPKVPNPDNLALYKKNRNMAPHKPGVCLIGQLASYIYFNMDQAILTSLEIFDTLHAKVKPWAPSIKLAMQSERWLKFQTTGCAHSLVIFERVEALPLVVCRQSAAGICRFLNTCIQQPLAIHTHPTNFGPTHAWVTDW